MSEAISKGSLVSKLGPVMILIGFVSQLFAMSSNLVAGFQEVVALLVLSFIFQVAASITILLLQKEIISVSHKTLVIVAVVFSSLSALFIFIGLVIYGVRVQYINLTPAYSTTLIVCTFLLDIGGVICLLLEILGVIPSTVPMEIQRNEA